MLYIQLYCGFSGSAEDSRNVDTKLLFDYTAFFKSIWPGKGKRHQFEYDIKTDESAFNLKVGSFLLCFPNCHQEHKFSSSITDSNNFRLITNLSTFLSILFHPRQHLFLLHSLLMTIIYLQTRSLFLQGHTDNFAGIDRTMYSFLLAKHLHLFSMPMSRVSVKTATMKWKQLAGYVQTTMMQNRRM